MLTEQGYLKVAEVPKRKKADDTAASGGQVADGETDDKDESEINKKDMENPAFIAMLASLKRGMQLPVDGFAIKEGETSPQNVILPVP